MLEGAPWFRITISIQFEEPWDCRGSCSPNLLSGHLIGAGKHDLERLLAGICEVCLLDKFCHDRGLLSLHLVSRVTKCQNGLNRTRDVTQLDIVIEVAKHVEQDLACHLQRHLFQVSEVDLIVVVIPVWYHYHLLANNLVNVLHHVKEVVIEELRVLQEALVVCADELVDPARHILLHLPEVNLIDAFLICRIDY